MPANYHDCVRIIALEAALRQAVMELREAANICRAHYLPGSAGIFDKAADRKFRVLTNQEEPDNEQS